MAYTEEERKQRAREATKRWRERNPERVLELSRKNNKDAYWKNPEKRRTQVKEWRENNKERHAHNHREWRKKNRDHINTKQRENYTSRLYGISIAERDAILKAQGDVCATCKKGSDHRGWVIDHCHSKGNVRGILCHRCNVALGLVCDNTETLVNMVSYLGKNNG